MLMTLWLAQEAGITVDGLPTGILNGLGVVSVVVLGGWLLATGRLYTRGQMHDVQHDRDEWRAEGRLKDAQMAEKDKQLAEKDRQLTYLREVGETSKAVLSALQRLASGEVKR